MEKIFIFLFFQDETIKNPPHEEQLYRKWCMYGIAAYVALLAIVQTLPMYTWLKGCVSGMMMVRKKYSLCPIENSKSLVLSLTVCPNRSVFDGEVYVCVE